MNDITKTLKDYYRNPSVRSRMMEFLGGDSPDNTTCEYITADGLWHPRRQPVPVHELSSKLDDGLDICRSLWDRESLIAHLDVEYVNFDFAAEAYLDPQRIFELQEPVAKAVESLLLHFGIQPLHVLSGRGHHYIWSVHKDSEAFDQLVQLSECHSPVEATPRIPHGNIVPRALSKGFFGLGLVMEFLAHEIKKLAEPESLIPIELTAVEVKPSVRGREMISLDVSEYGDPLSTRTTRVPFSGYLKPWQQVQAMGTENIQRFGALVFVPLCGMTAREGMVVMRDTGCATDLAGKVSTEIPNQAAGTVHLVNAYCRSPLKTYHDWFYSEDQDPVESWPNTYDRTPLESLPANAREALACPNDLLLRPFYMRLVTRILLALDWHPRHIAGLIRSKFERDYAWGDQWVNYSPAMRAEFYTRIFSSQMATGYIPAVDISAPPMRPRIMESSVTPDFSPEHYIRDIKGAAA
ncbi:MAG: hypothetical protein ACOYM3_18965 [Terrimicrobiaceae bacterium]